MVVCTDYESYEYKGETLRVTVKRHYNDGKNTNNVIIFQYKGMEIKRNFDEDGIFQHIIEEECSLLDRLGEDRYKTYASYRQRIEEIEKVQIVTNNKVYNYSHQNLIDGEACHFMWLKMQNETTIFGDSPLSHLESKDSKHKGKVFKNLVNNVKKYYNETGVEPEELAINEELTLEYMQMRIWIQNNV